MIRNTRANAVITGLMTLSLMLSMLGMAPVAVADVGSESSGNVTEEADDALNQGEGNLGNPSPTDQVSGNPPATEGEGLGDDGASGAADGGDTDPDNTDALPDSDNGTDSEADSGEEEPASRPHTDEAATDTDDDTESELSPMPNGDAGISTSGTGIGILADGTTTVSATITMADGGPIPPDLSAWVYGPGNPAIETISIPSGGTSETIIFSTAFPNEPNHGLRIGGGGYSSAFVVTMNQPERHLNINLPRKYADLNLTVNTSDSEPLPAGTNWTLTHPVNGEVAGGALTEPLASGGLLASLLVEFGEYQLAFSPQSDPTGRYVVAETIPVSLTISTRYTYDMAADVEITQQPVGELGFTVRMTDGGPIPNGLIWTFYEPGAGWVPTASGPVTPGITEFAYDFDEPFPQAGGYGLWITGNGYSSGQSIWLNSDSLNHGFQLDRLYGDLAVTVTTSDGKDIPAGTTWEITDSAGVVVQSGELAEALSDGSTLPVTNPLQFDVYTLTIDAEEYLPFSMVLNITNPWISEYQYTAKLLQEYSAVSFTVSMSDDGPLPNGLQWMLVASGSEEPLDSGDITAGEDLFADAADDPVTNGTYELRVFGHGYSATRALEVNSGDIHHDFVLDRLYVDLTLVLNTSDDGDIPAGTTLSIVDSAGNTVQEGVLAEALENGSNLPITSPIEFDIYTLVINADGYHPVTLELSLIDPAQTEMTTTVNLVSDREPAPDPSPSPSPSPTPDPSPVPDPDPDPAPKPDPVPPVTGLPETGTGESSGSTISMLVLVGSMITLAAGCLLRIRESISRS